MHLAGEQMRNDGFNKGDIVVDAVDLAVFDDVVREPAIARAREDRTEEHPSPLFAVEILALFEARAGDGFRDEDGIVFCFSLAADCKESKFDSRGQRSCDSGGEVVDGVLHQRMGGFLFEVEGVLFMGELTDVMGAVGVHFTNVSFGIEKKRNMSGFQIAGGEEGGGGQRDADLRGGLKGVCHLDQTLVEEGEIAAEAGSHARLSGNPEEFFKESLSALFFEGF